MGQRSERMKKRRHTPEQIVRKLGEADRLVGEGRELPEVVKFLELSEPTHHRWRAQYGGMKADDVKRLKELRAAAGRAPRPRPGDRLPVRPDRGRTQTEAAARR
jgi:putative transposase